MQVQQIQSKEKKNSKAAMLNVMHQHITEIGPFGSQSAIVPDHITTENVPLAN